MAITGSTSDFSFTMRVTEGTTSCVNFTFPTLDNSTANTNIEYTTSPSSWWSTLFPNCIDELDALQRLFKIRLQAYKKGLFRKNKIITNSVSKGFRKFHNHLKHRTNWRGRQYL